MSGPTSGLAHLFRQLKTTAAARALPKLADRARAEEWSYEQLAAAPLNTETDSRDSHGGRARIKAARFPARKTIEEFDFAFQSSLPKNIILHLGQLDFLAGKETRRGSLFAPRYGVSFHAALPATPYARRTSWRGCGNWTPDGPHSGPVARDLDVRNRRDHGGFATSGRLGLNQRPFRPQSDTVS